MPLTEDHRIDLDAMAAMIRPEHKLVALAHVSNVLGSVLDAKRAAEIAHSVGAKLLLDGCQAVPRMPVDVAALDCDFYVFSGHKLYGPTGIGVLWARAEILDAMPPWQGGGAMIDKVTFEKTTYAPPPARFEAGTPHVVGVIGLHAAIDYVDGDRPRRDRRARGGAGPRDARRARRRSTRSACSGRRTAPASSASRSRGCIRTTSAPYWTRAGWRSGPGIIAPSRLMDASRRGRDRAGELRGL